MEALLAETDEQIHACLPVLQQLRTTLSLDDLFRQLAMQRQEGYRLAMLCSGVEVATVAGFRVQHMLCSGKTMYVDDLVTAKWSRSKGHGRAMLMWLVELARAEDCATFSLDSGTQRMEAHAFYLRERLRITSFHFAMPLMREQQP